MIEKLLAPGSFPELAMRHCVFGKDTLRLFPIRAKQSIRCSRPASSKTCKQNPKKGYSALV